VGRRRRSFGCVTISVVLRLLTEALERGRLAGQLEVVETGEQTLVRDADEVVAFLRERTEPARPKRDVPGK
jgi:hypothetical protein